MKLLDKARGRGRSPPDYRRGREYLGMGLSNLVNLLNPDEIILAGYYTAAADLLLPVLREEVEKRY